MGERKDEGREEGGERGGRGGEEGAFAHPPLHPVFESFIDHDQFASPCLCATCVNMFTFTGAPSRPASSSPWRS